MITIRRRALTLKDLLVVIATVAVGGSVGIPALSRAREAERSATCQANLRLLGYGVTMYAADQAGSLPGPTTLAVPYNCGPSYLPAGTVGPAYYKVQFTSYLAPYVADHRDGRPADLIPFCPTADSLPVKSSGGQPWYFQPRNYYVLNNSSGFEHPLYPVKYGTRPPYYFGRINVGSQVSSLPQTQLPKKLTEVANPSNEWGVADLWTWEAVSGGGRGTRRPVGTWPLPISEPYTSGMITSSAGLKIPSYPFHQTSRSFAYTNVPYGVDAALQSPRLTTGRTNAIYFDGHTDSVQRWTGTVNPCYDTNLDKQCD